MMDLEHRQADLEFAKATTLPERVDEPPPDRGPGPRLLSASTIKGDAIINFDNETLGHVEEVMLDTEVGRIAYVVMASGGFLGLGERLFAIPWSSLRLDPDRECLVLDMAKSRFDAVQGFDKNHWPDMAQHEWQLDLHRHYGARPYWD